MDVRLALIGLLVGLLVGISGVGGSSLMTPLLIMVLRINPLVAVGTDLAYSVPTKLLGAIVHWRQGTVNRRAILYLCLGGLPGAVVGLVTLAGLHASLGTKTLNTLVKHGVGVLLFVAAAAVLLTPLLSRRARAHSQTPEPAARSRVRGLVTPGQTPAEPVWSHTLKSRTVLLGAVVGFLVSLTSIGSGAIAVPVSYLLMPRLGLRHLVGSNVAFAAVLIPVATAGHLALGNVNLAISANLLIGSLPGVFIGSKLCAGLPDIWLQPAIAGVLVWAGGNLVSV